MIDIDAIDRQILRSLAQDASQNGSILGRQLGLSQSATWRRIKRLTEAGVLSGQRVAVDAAALGFGVQYFWVSNWPPKGASALRILNVRSPVFPKCKLCSMFWAFMITVCGWWRAILGILSGSCDAAS